MQPITGQLTDTGTTIDREKLQDECLHYQSDFFKKKKKKKKSTFGKNNSPTPFKGTVTVRLERSDP